MPRQGPDEGARRRERVASGPAEACPPLSPRPNGGKLTEGRRLVRPRSDERDDPDEFERRQVPDQRPNRRHVARDRIGE